jgi:glycosyltransferase involved in cell wall biosynthesis
MTMTRTNSSDVDISVVIPCRNGADVLGSQLDALLAQHTSAVFEVIVADNGSTDDTAALVWSYAARDDRVRLVDASRGPGANVARNDGIRAARGDFILLCDADDRVHPGWLNAHWRAFTGGARSVGGGIDRVLETGQVLSRERRLYRSSVGVSFANATNCGFTADAFHQVGGFDESFIGGADEVEFFYRLTVAGHRPRFVSGAVVDKLQHTNLGDAFRQYFNFGVGEARLLRKFMPRRLMPMAALSMVQVVWWGIVWAITVTATSSAHRSATCTFAWHLGVLSEGARLMSTGSIAGSSLTLPVDTRAPLRP